MQSKRDEFSAVEHYIKDKSLILTESVLKFGNKFRPSSQNNLILHEHLYPNATRKAQRLNRRGGTSTINGRDDKKSFNFLR